MAENIEADYITKCGHCGENVPISERRCLYCSEDAGAPNVKITRTPTEGLTATRRWTHSENLCRMSERHGVFLEFCGVAKTSHVVISRNIEDLYSTLHDHHFLLGSFRNEVSLFELNRHEAGAQARLFELNEIAWSGYSAKLTFGVLSLNGKGAEAHGQYHLQLSDKFIEKRVSFLESSVGIILKEHKATGRFPAGYRANWGSKQFLCGNKVVHRILAGMVPTEFDGALVNGNESKVSASYIEAQIYDFTTKARISRFTAPPPVRRRCTLPRPNRVHVV